MGFIKDLRKKEIIEENLKTHTQQCFKEEVDINNIVSRFKKSGEIPQFNPIYGDVFDIGDYQSALEKINNANELFYSVPAYVRKKFNNDVDAFLNFFSDEKNLDEIYDLGLLNDDGLKEYMYNKKVKEKSSVQSEDIKS